MRLSDDIQQKIVDLYKIHRNAKIVSEILGVCMDSVKRYAERAGLQTNDRSFSRRCRKDIPNYLETFPDDDRILGYICGFIAADGNLNKKDYSIHIEVQKRDEKVLRYMVSNLIKEDYKYKERLKGNSHTIRICSASPIFLNYLRSLFGGTITNQGGCGVLQFKGSNAYNLSKILPLNEEYLGRKTIRIMSILQMHESCPAV